MCVYVLTQGSSVTSGELIWNLVSAHSKYLCSSPPHTSFWSWCKRHCWFSSKFVSVPEKTSNLWRSLLWKPLPPSTNATWEFSSLRPLPLSFSPYWECWTVQMHRRWILPPTRSRTWWLRGQGWKSSFGPVTSIPQESNQILYPAHYLQYHKYSVFLFLLTSTFRYVVVLQYDVIDLETISTNLHQNSASPQDLSCDTCRPCHSSSGSTSRPSSPRHTCSPTTTRSRIPFLQDNQGTPVYFHRQDLSNNTYLSW